MWHVRLYLFGLIEMLYRCRWKAGLSSLLKMERLQSEDVDENSVRTQLSMDFRMSFPATAKTWRGEVRPGLRDYPPELMLFREGARGRGVSVTAGRSPR